MKNLFTLKTLGWVISSLVAIMLGMSAIGKITYSEEMVKNFDFFRITPLMVYIGIFELLSTILFLIPRTSMFGSIALTTIMSGASAVHIVLLGGAGIFLPITIGLLAWSGHCLRTYKVSI
jgi:hypothetical protein